MKNFCKLFFIICTFMFCQLSASAVDMMCTFDEVNEKVPDIKVHNIRIHVFFNDDKNSVGYVHFGKNKKVDSVIDYNYDFLIFKIKYHYAFGKTDVMYKIDRVSNEISTYRSEVVNGNPSYTVYYKGLGKCEVIPRGALKSQRPRL